MSQVHMRCDITRGHNINKHFLVFQEKKMLLNMMRYMAMINPE